METSFLIGSWLVEPQLNRITGSEGRVNLEPRTMKVLLYLAQRKNEVVSREELLEVVWEGAIVTEHSLTIAISDLRKIFGDDPRAPGVIETIRGVGYRLIAPVEKQAGHMYDTPVLSVPHQGDGLATEYPASAQKPRRVWVWGIAAMLIAVAVWLSDSLSQDNGEMTIRNIKPLTTMAGIEIAPSFSPDSRRVAFAAFPDSGGLSDIYIHQIGAPAPVRLTEEPGAELAPTWSPDGQFVLYLSYSDTSCTLYKRPSFGGAALKLLDVSCRISGMSWAPDGNTVILSAYDNDHTAMRLFSLSMDDLKLKPVTTPSSLIVGDIFPHFSPDGQKIAFVRNLDNATQDIYVTNAQNPTARPERVTWDRVPVYGFDWEADGKSIVFASGREGKKGLWRVGVSGSKHPRLIREVDVEDPGAISLAESGRQMVYTDWTYEVNIWRVNISDSARRSIARSTRVDAYPQISSQNKLAFVSSRTGFPEVWVSNADGEDAVNLTNLEHSSIRSPAWSPDGKRIVFESRERDHSDIYMIDAAGGMPERIEAAGSMEMRPTWSGDGQSVYFGSDRSGTWQIWNYSLVSGDVRQITEEGGLGGWESEDGSRFFYIKPDTSGIWMQSMEEKKETFLVDADPSSITLVNQHLYYIDPVMQIDSYAIMRFNLNTGISETVTSIPVRPFNIFSRWGFTVSRDEERIYYGQIDKSESDLFIAEWER